jgi:hypothetical protein
MSTDREVALWPSRKNYLRFAAVCDDDIPATFDEFEALATARLAEIEALHSIIIDKVSFDPDRMEQWCRTNFGKVDSYARKAYANFLALSD